MTQSTWTDEQISRATEMWSTGATAQEVADTIGKSRNAVIGKMNRLNVKRQETGENAAPPDASRNISSTQDQDTSAQASGDGTEPASVHHPPSTDLVDSEALFEHINQQRLPLMYLSSKTCRWPIGDPSTKNFWFCGKQSAIDKPYCAEHSELAFQNSPKTGTPENSNSK